MGGGGLGGWGFSGVDGCKALDRPPCYNSEGFLGWGLGGSKVGWVGPKLGGWVLSKIPPPLVYKRSLPGRREVHIPNIDGDL